MEVLILLVFVSTMLVICAIGFFAWTVREDTYDYADKLTLLPLEEEQQIKDFAHARPKRVIHSKA